MKTKSRLIICVVFLLGYFNHPLPSEPLPTARKLEINKQTAIAGTRWIRMGSAVVDAIQSARVRHYSYINGEYQLFTCKIEGKQNVDKFREWIRKNVAPAFNRHPLDAGIYNEHPNFQLTVYSKPIPEGDDFLFTFPMGAVFEGVTDKSFLDIAKEWGVTLSSGEK